MLTMIGRSLRTAVIVRVIQGTRAAVAHVRVSRQRTTLKRTVLARAAIFASILASVLALISPGLAAANPAQVYATYDLLMVSGTSESGGIVSGNMLLAVIPGAWTPAGYWPQNQIDLCLWGGNLNTMYPKGGTIKWGSTSLCGTSVGAVGVTGPVVQLASVTPNPYNPGVVTFQVHDSSCNDNTNLFISPNQGGLAAVPTPICNGYGTLYFGSNGLVTGGDMHFWGNASADGRYSNYNLTVYGSIPPTGPYATTTPTQIISPK